MGILETLKDVATLVQKADNIQLLKEVLALQTQAQELLEDNRKLKARIQELEAALDLVQSLEFRAPFYHAPGDETPFCPKCREVDRRAVHLVLVFRNTRKTRWDCKQCQQSYLVEL